MGFWDLFTETVTAVNGHHGDDRNRSNAAAASSSAYQSSSDGSSGICSGNSIGASGMSIPAGLTESDFARLQEMFTQG